MLYSRIFFLSLVCCENTFCFRNNLPVVTRSRGDRNHKLHKRVYSCMGWGHNAFLWAVWGLMEKSWGSCLKRLGRNPIPDLGFIYPADFSGLKFQAWTGIQIEANGHFLLIEDLKLQAGISPTSELFPLLCFVASAHLSSSIRSKETQRPPCQWQMSCAFFPDTSFLPTTKFWDKVGLGGLLRCAGHGEAKACNLGVSQPQYLCKTDIWRWRERRKDRPWVWVSINLCVYTCEQNCG